MIPQGNIAHICFDTVLCILYSTLLTSPKSLDNCCRFVRGTYTTLKTKKTVVEAKNINHGTCFLNTSPWEGIV